MIVLQRALIYIAAFLSLFAQTEAVKDYLFKKCDQNPFCHRNRHLASQVTSNASTFSSQYSIDEKSIKYDLIHSTFKGDILKQLNDESKVVLPFEINVLEDNNVRLRIDEAKRIKGDIEVPDKRLTKRRYNEAYKYALKNGGNDLHGLADDVELKYEKLDDRTIIQYGPDLEYLLTLEYSPFKLTFSLSGQDVMVLNDGNLLNMEHWRPSLENDTVNLSPYESDFNMFKDTFKDSKGDKLPFGPESIALDISMVGIDHLYGLSEHASQKLELQDTINSGKEPYRLFNVDIFEYEDEQQYSMYGAIPFIMGVSKEFSAGVFWINGADTYIDINKKAPSSHATSGEKAQKVLQATETKSSSHWMSENGIIDVILMVDKKPELINKKYGSLVGNSQLPPLFSLGYHQCRWNYNDQKDVLDIHEKFDSNNISYDSIWLDIEYTDSKMYFTWKEELFPDPMEMMKELNETGRNLIAIIDPHIKTGYEVSKQIESKNIAIQNSDNSNAYHGHCWPGESIWIDTFNPDAQKYWAELFEDSEKNKFIGKSTNLHLWNDMNEPSVFNGPETSAPKDIIHFGGWEHRSVHNIYGQTFHEATYSALTKRNPNARPFVLTRSFYAGSQRTAAMWTGDNMSKWEYLKLSIPMNINQGLVNFIFSGSDVGGFFGNPSSELLTRWYQTGIWYPFFRGHAHIDSRRREPWVPGGEYTDIMRDAIDLRYKLLPSFYTAFYENTISGMPFLKPIFYEAPSAEKAFSIEDEFFVSETGLLVKPITDENCKTTTVYFPDDSKYYDFYTHELVSDKEQEIAVSEITLASLPVYHKGGHILATKERHRRSSQLQKYDPYSLTIALDADNRAAGKLYIDDGQTFNYEKGEFIVVKFTYENGELRSNVEKGGANDKNEFMKLMNTVKIEKVTILGSSKSFQSVEISEDGKVLKHSAVTKTGNDLIVKKPDVAIGKDWKMQLK